MAPGASWEGLGASWKGLGATWKGDSPLVLLYSFGKIRDDQDPVCSSYRSFGTVRHYGHDDIRGADHHIGYLESLRLAFFLLLALSRLSQRFSRNTQVKDRLGNKSCMGRGSAPSSDMNRSISKKFYNL